MGLSSFLYLLYFFFFSLSFRLAELFLPFSVLFLITYHFSSRALVKFAM